MRFVCTNIISNEMLKRKFGFFQLEEGEIDVRLLSFKGCFIQRSGRLSNNNWKDPQTMMARRKNSVKFLDFVDIYFREMCFLILFLELPIRI